MLGVGGIAALSDWCIVGEPPAVQIDVPERIIPGAGDGRELDVGAGVEAGRGTTVTVLVMTSSPVDWPVVSEEAVVATWEVERVVVREETVVAACEVERTLVERFAVGSECPVPSGPVPVPAVPVMAVPFGTMYILDVPGCMGVPYVGGKIPLGIVWLPPPNVDVPLKPWEVVPFRPTETLEIVEARLVVPGTGELVEVEVTGSC